MYSKFAVPHVVAVCMYCHVVCPVITDVCGVSVLGTRNSMYMFLMRDEKEERKKQARSNKQTRQSNTSRTCTYRAISTCKLRVENKLVQQLLVLASGH